MSDRADEHSAAAGRAAPVDPAARSGPGAADAPGPAGGLDPVDGPVSGAVADSASGAAADPGPRPAGDSVSGGVADSASGAADPGSRPAADPGSGPAGDFGPGPAGLVRFPLRAPANPVSRKAVALWLLHGLSWSVFVVVGSFFLARWAEDDRWSWLPDWVLGNIWWVPALTALLLLPAAIVEPFWRYAVHRWELSEDVVYTRSGWVSREWAFVPVSRIQTVDKAQGWTERALGLATVEIRTASHAGSSRIKGLDYEVAAGLAASLAHRAEQLRDDAT
ncbi:hypothetical protein FHS43_003116 [Streptosporangium becharense]|uniref:Membrane protein YdbS with pleckstrin-like domain n=1 Tax=Streptosporangium becharense TaxID=1816182 RepID=A0A7W9ILN9_9ACTN|nr:PH domain-containing protein [Streptosporangium becharense]MBB2911843.1 hypothetical protein [Streptosporangium becharense]MBB5822339.1 membrane protein YdbS with pleckstrin-like domain [Streptosporangium becharense]